MRTVENSTALHEPRCRDAAEARRRRPRRIRFICGGAAIRTSAAHAARRRLSSVSTAITPCPFGSSLDEAPTRRRRRAAAPPPPAPSAPRTRKYGMRRRRRAGRPRADDEGAGAGVRLRVRPSHGDLPKPAAADGGGERAEINMGVGGGGGGGGGDRRRVRQRVGDAVARPSGRPATRAATTERKPRRRGESPSYLRGERNLRGAVRSAPERVPPSCARGARKWAAERLGERLPVRESVLTSSDALASAVELPASHSRRSCSAGTTAASSRALGRPADAPRAPSVPRVRGFSIARTLGAGAPACVAQRRRSSRHASVISSEKTAAPTSHASAAAPRPSRTVSPSSMTRGARAAVERHRRRPRAANRAGGMAARGLRRAGAAGPTRGSRSPGGGRSTRRRRRARGRLHCRGSQIDRRRDYGRLARRGAGGGADARPVAPARLAHQPRARRCSGARRADVDVTVIGGGPAGFTRSRRCWRATSTRWRSSTRRPRSSWPNNYGSWRVEWEALASSLRLPELLDCVRVNWGVTDCFFGGSFDTPFEDRTRLDAPYLQVDRTKLKALLEQQHAAHGVRLLAAPSPPKPSRPTSLTAASSTTPPARR